MLRETWSTVIGGTTVTLVGTAHGSVHTRSEEAFEEGATEVYDVLCSIAPDLLLLELEPGVAYDNSAATRTDIAGLTRYIDAHQPAFENHDPPVKQGKATWYLEYDQDTYEGALEREGQTEEYRAYTQSEMTAYFHDWYEQREEGTIAHVVDAAFGGDYTTIAVHCGYAHFDALREPLALLAD
jgi:hypothetical protein